MRPVAFFCCLLTGAGFLCARSTNDPNSVTVLMDFTGEQANLPLPTLQSELQNILSGSHLRISLKLRSELSNVPVYGDLVLFKMKGYCTMNALPVAALSDERGPLAMTYLADGQLLPFGEVECDRVRTAVQRIVGRGEPEAHKTEYAIALARVMAHEIYHMLAQSSTHARDGITKEALSSTELSQGVMHFNSASQQAVQKHFSNKTTQ